jgi:hypothetical protein
VSLTNLEALTARLSQAGIDPAVVLETGATPLIAHAARCDAAPGPWLDALATYVEALQRMGATSFWSPLRFCVPQLARVAAADAARFGALLQKAALLLEEVGRAKIDQVRTEQYGIPSAAQALEGQPEACERMLQLALTLAQRGAEPGWLLQLAVPALWTAAGADAGGFSRLVDALEKTALVLHAAKIHTGHPFATAVAALATHEAAGAHLPAWLEQLGRLGGSLAAGGARPYPVFGYGVANLLGLQPLSAAEVTSHLELGVLLADRGMEPARVLARTDHPATFAPLPPARYAALCLELAREGIDPFFPVGRGAPAIGDACGGASGDRFLERLLLLARDLHAKELSGEQLFGEGLGVLAQLEQRFPGLFERGFALAEALVQRGLPPGLTVTHGLPRALARVEPGRPEVALCLDTAFALVELGYAPYPVLAYAFRPLMELAEGSEGRLREMLEALQRLIATLQREGIDSHEVLFHDVRELAETGAEARAFIDLLGRVERLFGALRAAGVDPAPMAREGLPSAAREARGRPWILVAALELAEGMAASGRDPTLLFTGSLAAVARTAGDDPSDFGALLTTVERRFAHLPPELIGPATTAACHIAGRRAEVLGEILDEVARRFGGHPLPEAEAGALASLPVLAALATTPAELFTLVDATLAALTSLPLEGKLREAWLHAALPAVVELCAGDGPRGLALLPRLAQAAAAGEPHCLALTFGAERLARACEGDADAFLALLSELDGVARRFLSLWRGTDPVRLLLEQLLVIARAASPDARGFQSAFAQLVLTADTYREDPGLPQLLVGIQGLVETHPAAWSALVCHTLTAQRRPTAVLEALWRITRWHLRAPSDFELLRELVTQEGVRAGDILLNLVLPALGEGVIRDLTAERSQVLRFVREVGVFEPSLLLEYQRIWRDSSVADAEKQARSRALISQIGRLTGRIRQGALEPEDEQDPLLGAALIRTFPPAVSDGKARYLALYASFPDHPEHLAARDPGPDLRSREYRLACGSWQVRDQVEWDRGLWDRLGALLQALPDEDATPAAALGWTLLTAWVDGRIGREAQRWPLLARVLARMKQAGVALPVASQTAPQLIAFRELLADGCRDQVEALLLAARAEAPERYERLVREKLLPRPKIGPGLVRGVRHTLDALREGRLDEGAALERLQAQLEAFALGPEALTSLRALEPSELRGALEGLSPRAQTLEPGKEISRLHADFLGPPLQRMQQVLFGGPGGPGCLVYQLASDAVPVWFEPTKRRAHAAVGFNEGVCVASDLALWNTPTFFQTVIWSAEGVARGGFHLLIVEDEGGAMLTLPGINPSLALLKEVGAGPVLDAVVDYAWRLARAWGLGGVWIPAQPGIHSNRHELHLELAARGWASQHVRVHRFSHSPFAYSFDEVLTVPERYLPEAGPGA